MKLLSKFSSILTAAAIIAASAVIPVCAAGRLTYTFTGDEAAKPGYAEGKITLESAPSGEYKLYWADDNSALGGYYEIAALKSGRSFSFSEHTLIPPEATKLIATTGSKKVAEAAAVFDIPENKRFKYKSSDALYSFMNYSDIHIDEAKNTYYKFSELHWQKALETAARRGADFIVTAGDNITNAEGPGREFDKFQQILSDSPFCNPVYEGSGNHELRAGTPDSMLSAFVSATGLDGKQSTIKKGKPYYLVEEPGSGDLFIFMALEYKYSPDEGDEFSPEQLSWLEKTLSENYGKGKNIFLIQHALIEGYGAGDDEDNYYTVPLKTKYKTTVQFRDIILKYPKLIWISGHTHIALRYGYNYSNMNDTSCHMIHDSSVCCPTTLNYASHNLSYDAASGEENKDFTEGYYSQVYPDEVVFFGENLYHDKIYPASCYIMESCRENADKLTNKDSAEVSPVLPGSADFVLFAERCVSLPKSFTYKGVSDSDLKALREMCKTLLGEMYSFASYDDYQALKKAYQNDKTDYKTLCEAYLKVFSHSREGIVNIYFTNSKGWKQPYAKLSSAKNSNGATGEPLKKIGKDKDGNEVYTLEVNSRRYSTVVFTDGTDEKQSEPQTLNGKNNTLYALNGSDPSSPYYCYVREYEG